MQDTFRMLFVELMTGTPLLDEMGTSESSKFAYSKARRTCRDIAFTKCRLQLLDAHTFFNVTACPKDGYWPLLIFHWTTHSRYSTGR